MYLILWTLLSPLDDLFLLPVLTNPIWNQTMLGGLLSCVCSCTSVCVCGCVVILVCVCVYGCVCSCTSVGVGVLLY